MPERRLLKDRILVILTEDSGIAVDDIWRALRSDGYVNYQTVQYTLKKMTETGLLQREEQYGGYGRRYIYRRTD